MLCYLPHIDKHICASLYLREQIKDIKQLKFILQL